MTPTVPVSVKSALERTAHPFYVWEGIMSTPQALEALREQEFITTVSRVAKAMQAVQEIHFVGCGTSYFSSIASTYAFRAVAATPATAYNAFEYSTYLPSAGHSNALVAISHTGETAAVLDCVKPSNENGAVTIALTDVAESPLAQTAQYVILGTGGREPSLPKTRSYVTSLFKAYLLAIELAAVRGKNCLSYRSALDGMPEKVADTLRASESAAKELAAAYRRAAKVCLVGGGPNVATICEGALKLAEMAQRPGLAWELEEAMHGPWVTIEEGDLVVLVAFRGPALAKAIGFAEALQHIGAKIWVITDEPGAFEGSALVTAMPPGIPETFSPLCAILPIYQFVYYLALERGTRPDAMRLTDDRYLAARLAMPR